MTSRADWRALSSKAPCLVFAAIVLATAPPAAAGLGQRDWVQIRAALGAVPPPFVHEASLFGHGDLTAEAWAMAGYSVSVSGDTAVVGAPQATGAGGLVGASHVFVRSGGTWTEQQRIVAPDPHYNPVEPESFGAAVSIYGNILVVGAPRHGYNPTGAVYVFVRTGSLWSFQQELQGSDAGYHAYFGSAVSISSDTLVVGAPGIGFGPQPDYAGAAYVFTRPGAVWGEQQKLQASDGAAGDALGRSVSVAGDTVVVGAPGADSAAGADSGAAYAFLRTGVLWTQQQKLLPPEAGAAAEFGNAVALEGDTAVVAAHLADSAAGTDAGAAYVFARTGAVWGLWQQLFASDAAPALAFGEAASISGDTIALGAMGGQGAAYVFARSGSAWMEQQELQASDAAPGSLFGGSVSVAGDTLVVGAPGAGLGYIFTRAVDTWVEEQALTPSDDVAYDDLGRAAALDGGHPGGRRTRRRDR